MELVMPAFRHQIIRGGGEIGSVATIGRVMEREFVIHLTLESVPRRVVLLIPPDMIMVQDFLNFLRT
jgi:hypothetical protein